MDIRVVERYIYSIYMYMYRNVIETRALHLEESVLYDCKKII